MGTPQADKELAEFKQLAIGPVQSSFHYHHARLIDMLYGIEKDRADPHRPAHPRQACPRHRRRQPPRRRRPGRSPTRHAHAHYKVDENGLITWANLVIATGQNNNAMNKGVLQAARAYVKDGKFTEGVLNRVEAVIRTFDPCLSCSTHAFGQMPLVP
jgi:NAD-reducing hydrogenase large subunit